MRFDDALLSGWLERRYKRFLADVRLDGDERITCHCPNTGSMMGCSKPGSRVWLSRSNNPRRKYAHTWEVVEVGSGALVGIHTGRTNALVAEAVADGVLPSLQGYGVVRREVTVPDAPMRADFHLSGHPEAADCFLEVKNVTAAVGAGGIALFPDAVSERGRRHIEVLMALKRRGLRAALVFCAQRADVTEIRPADEIDPAYGRALRAGIAAGVEVFGVGATVTEWGIHVDRTVPVVCP
ncbi:MAG TPA: DNA/RNA nuclease SfsA [Gammaproteobacteria bacterium]|nr:DNA/RNA nuclease SfsA [Gammaproteobacteria bacterium]